MVEDVHEFKAPSGDIYGIRRLTYREKKSLQRKATKSETVMDTKTKESKITQTFDVYTFQEEALWKTIVNAPWLPEGKKCTIEDLDKIKSEDCDALDKFVDNLNFPKSEDLEK